MLQEIRFRLRFCTLLQSIGMVLLNVSGFMTTAARFRSQYAMLVCVLFVAAMVHQLLRKLMLPLCGERHEQYLEPEPCLDRFEDVVELRFRTSCVKIHECLVVFPTNF